MTERPHERSDRLRKRAERRVPGGVNSNVRLGMPRIVFERASGAWLWDVDGNDYVDYLLGQGPAFLGHAPPAVLEAVEQLRAGLSQPAARQDPVGEIIDKEIRTSSAPCQWSLGPKRSGTSKFHGTEMYGDR
jgi:glutamate-1-semialdehyde aminotransferase